MNRFAREARANHYAPLGARRRSGVGLLPQAVCGLSGGPFPLNRFARETRANRYAPLGARRSAGADGHTQRGCSGKQMLQKKNQRGSFPTLFVYLLIFYMDMVAAKKGLQYNKSKSEP